MTTNLLEKLEALKDQAAAPDATPAAPQATAAPAVRGGNVRTNQFAGTCVKCHRTVEPEAGFLGGSKATGWTVSHGECPETAPEPTPFRVTSSDRALPEEGVYVLEDGSIVKIKSNKAKTNRYANVWVKIGGERLTEAGEHVNGEWEYAPALRSACKPEYRMTLDQAKEFGVLYGKCVKCGRHLSDAKSVEAAIGPVCARSFSL